MDGFHIAHGGVKPYTEGVGWQDHRHPLADRSEHCMWCGGDGRVGIEGVAVGGLPVVPECSGGERLTELEFDVVGLRARRIPLQRVDAVGQNQAAALRFHVLFGRLSAGTSDGYVPTNACNRLRVLSNPQVHFPPVAPGHPSSWNA